MTLSTSYLDGPFPMDVQLNGGQNARLFAVFGSKVAGIVYWGDDPETAWSSDACLWDAEGVYSAEHPTLNLIPPPGLREAQRQKLLAEIGEIEQRLRDNPNAPLAWIEADKRALSDLELRAKELEA